MSWTGDPLRDFDIREAERMRRERRKPRCSDCSEPIESELCYVFGRRVYCRECLEELHEKWTEDLMSVD